jgi:GMP synthase-like glutamine amidotransferase
MSLLVVQHQDSCPPGRIGRWLTEAGVELDVRRPYAGDQLPHDLTGHDGLLVLGGEMSCRDDELAPWLPAVRKLIRTAAKGATPTLGICLGHQLASLALGGEVAVNPRGRTVGVLTVEPTSDLAQDSLFATTHGGPVVQWNNDAVTRLPDGAVRLADNERGDLLLARLAPTVWGVQGHPEADLHIVTGWAVMDSGTPAVAGIDLTAALGAVDAAQPQVDSTWRPVAQAFAALL